MRLAIAATLVLAAASACWALRPRESYVSGDTIGMQIDRGADAELVVALQQVARSAQWLACVPAIQLEKLARDQARTGVGTIRVADLLQAMQQRKTRALARVQRLGVSPAFKSALIQYVTYVMTSASDVIRQFADADGFVDLAHVADAVAGFRGGFCSNLGTNFGAGNSFLPATG